MNGIESVRPQLDRLQRRSLVAGALGLALCVGGAAFDPRQFFQSYLQAYLFWIGISLGGSAILMLHHLVGGRWGFPIRRLLEAGTRTLPLMAVLFLPILMGLRDLYAWARPAEVAADELLQHKSTYLNASAFTVRAVIYFAVWIGMTYFLNKWSLEQDRTADRSLMERLRRLSGPGLVLYGLTATFSAIDWVMSLEPRWFSTIYGMVFMAGHGLEAVAFAIIGAALLARRGLLAEATSPGVFRDLGNLTLTFLMLWAYLAFSQFLIVWAENLTDEIPWYLHRSAGGWGWVAFALFGFQFAMPFLLLLFREAKQSAAALAGVALVIIAMRMVDLFWLVAPAFHPGEFRLHWMDVVAPIGLGGLWLSVFVWHLKGRPALPLHDPRMEEALGRAGGA